MTVRPPAWTSLQLPQVANLVCRVFLSLLIASVVLASLLLSAPVFAQEGGIGPGETLSTNPKTRDNLVSATVPPSQPPSVPILIAPANNSYVTISRPAFVWRASTDDQGIDHYELSLDGNPLFTDIPTSAVDNSEYTLTFNVGSQEYTLVPKTDLSQGSHTWKIRAVDTQGLGTDSATWTFIIDTQAPSFVITQLGDQSVSISAQDSSTIPSSPLELGDNQPPIIATGEPNSSVFVTLTIPGDPTQNFTVPIAGDGSWSQILGTLPRDVVMTLDFVITDPAGNVSVLSGVEFIIPSDVIIIPPTPSPTPSPTLEPGATPTPTPTPVPGASPEPTPSPSPIPGIVIPVIPPDELLQEFGQELTERLAPLLQTLTQGLSEEVRQVIQETAEAVAPVSGLVVTTALPLTSAVAVASQFGGGLSFDLIIKILQALGLLPAGKPRGMVFDSQTYEPIAFALLTIKSTVQGQSLIETVVTNYDGLFSQLQLPIGSYELVATHQEYRFPTTHPRPPYLNQFEYYKGEGFKITKESDKPILFIPMDNLHLAGSLFSHSRWRLFLARLTRRLSWLSIPMFGLSGILAALSPSIWNLAVFGVYALIIFMKAQQWLRVALIIGRVVDEAGQPIERAIIRLSELGSNELVAVVLSDVDGYFKFFAPHKKYSISLIKAGYYWYEEGSPLSVAELDATTTRPTILATLKAVPVFSEAELFAIPAASETASPTLTV